MFCIWWSVALHLLVMAVHAHTHVHVHVDVHVGEGIDSIVEAAYTAVWKSVHLNKYVLHHTWDTLDTEVHVYYNTP